MAQMSEREIIISAFKKGRQSVLDCKRRLNPRKTHFTLIYHLNQHIMIDFDSDTSDGNARWSFRLCERSNISRAPLQTSYRLKYPSKASESSAASLVWGSTGTVSFSTHKSMFKLEAQHLFD